MILDSLYCVMLLAYLNDWNFTLAAADLEIFEREDSPLAVIYSITIFLFPNKII